MIYFNAWGIATLICCVFTLLILGFLLSIRNKSRNSLILVGFFIGGFVLDFGFLWSAVLPEPMGAWHRFLTVAGVFFPVTLMIAFAYNFPRLMYPREAIVAVTFFALLALGLSVHFYYQALQTQPEFSFNGNIFNYFEAPGKPQPLPPEVGATALQKQPVRTKSPKSLSTNRETRSNLSSKTTRIAISTFAFC